MPKLHDGLKSLWSTLGKSWQTLALILSLLLGLGIIQIQAIRLAVAPENLLLVLLSIAVVYLILRTIQLERNLSYARQEISRLEALATPPFLLENIALSTLLSNLESRRTVHRITPISLDVFRIECRVIGSDLRKDADVTYYLKGINISDRTLMGLHLTITGDNLVPYNVLNAKLYNLHAKNGKEHIQPSLEGLDSVAKNLFLPFVNPGIGHLDTFEIELKYVWPKTLNPVKDYWFLDNLDFQGRTKKISIVMDFVDVAVVSARIYKINLSSKIPSFQGILPPDPDHPGRFVFDQIDPEKDTYYILFYDSVN